MALAGHGKASACGDPGFLSYVLHLVGWRAQKEEATAVKTKEEKYSVRVGLDGQLWKMDGTAAPMFGFSRRRIRQAMKERHEGKVKTLKQWRLEQERDKRR